MALGSGTKINVTDCRFINNTGYGQGGGAIRLRTLVHGLTISGCWFEDNYGDTYGGAVHSDMGKENGGCVVDKITMGILMVERFTVIWVKKMVVVLLIIVIL